MYTYQTPKTTEVLELEIKKKMNHQIGKASLDIRASRKADGFTLQKEMSEWFWQALLPELNRVLDEAIPPDKVLQLERLDIDVPMMAKTNWREKLTPSVCRAIVEEITRRRLFPRPTDGAVLEISMTENGFAAWLSFIKTGQKPFAIGDFATWQTAALASVASSASALAMLKQVLTTEPYHLERLIRQHDTAFLVQLIEAMTGQSANILSVWQHAIRQLLSSKQFLSVIYAPFLESRSIRFSFWQGIFKYILNRQMIDSQAVVTLDFLLKQIEQLIGKPFTAKDMTTRLVHFFQIQLDNRRLGQRNTEGVILFRNEQIEPPQKEDAPTPEPIKQRVQAEESITAQLIFVKNVWTDIFESLPEKARLWTLFEPIFRATTDVIEQVLNDKKNQQNAITPSVKEAEIEEQTRLNLTDTASKERENFQKGISKDDLKQKEQATEIGFDSKKIKNKEDSVEKKSDLSEGESLFVGVAGIVLLHPFIKPFFEALELLNGSDFVDEKAQLRGVGLLQYLSVGDNELVEYDATLLKWLCGLPFDTPIDSRIDLTEAEKTEADELLETVIEHWGALGKVGAASLQEGFLQRDGKLSKRADGWLLQIEKQTIDILLDRLPWGVGIVKFPWQAAMLFVEW